MNVEEQAVPKELGKEDALRAYSRMMHCLSIEHLEPLLSDDFHYSSAWVDEVITTEKRYLDYMRPKLLSIQRSGNRVWAEMAWLPDARGPFLIIAQGEQENIVATLWAEVEGGQISRFDLREATVLDVLGRTGEYPT